MMPRHSPASRFHLSANATHQSGAMIMFEHFFQQQLDYMYFFDGLAFILLAAICAVMQKNREAGLSWNLLGTFGLVHGLNEWLNMLAISMDDTPALVILRHAMMALSFIILTEF